MSIIKGNTDIFKENGINKSFYEIYTHLESKGITNKDFLLEGCENNIHLDMYSDLLTDDQKDLIQHKCNMSPWYFLSNVKIPTMGGTCNYMLNIQNMSVIYLLKNNMSVYTNACRQTYSTMTRCIYYLWSLKRSKSFVLHVLSVRYEDSTFILKRILDINKLLPDFLKLDEEDIEKRVIPIQPPKSVHEVERKFRGFTGHLFINDFEHIKFIDVIITYLAPTLESYRVTLDMLSTIGKSHSIGKYTADALIMSPSTLKWFDKLLDVDFDATFRKNVFYVNYDYRELVDNPEKWYVNMMLLLNNDQYIIDREILMKR